MKKAIIWIVAAAFVVFLIAWGVMGLSLADGDYDITTEAAVGIVCLIVIFICAVYKLLSEKCPYCGKTQPGNGDYCSHCGKKIK